MPADVVPARLFVIRPGRHRGVAGPLGTYRKVNRVGGRHRGPDRRLHRPVMAAALLSAGLVTGPALTSAAYAESYTVQSGDTLSGIAQAHGISWRALYQLNRAVVSRPSRIYTGQRLQLSGNSGVSRTTDTDGSSETALESRSFGQRILGEAAKVAGVPYRYGGTSPATGFDCSGFTSYVFARVGKFIPRTAAAQASASRRVSRSELRAGDLIFYVSSGRVSHVAIYAGNGMVWEAPSSGRLVRYAPIWHVAQFYGRV